MNSSIQSLLTAVTGMRLPGPVTVFGSVARGDSGEFSDLDLVVDLRVHPCDALYQANSDLSAVHALLRLGRVHYGSFDPFLRFQDALLVRNPESTGWVHAKSARDILKNADQEGVSLCAVCERLAQESAVPSLEKPAA